jgi:hypothetical protein
MYDIPPVAQMPQYDEYGVNINDLPF